MKYKTIKNKSELVLPNVQVGFEKSDSGAVEGVYLVAAGRRFRIRRGDSYGRSLEVAELVKETEKKWTLRGTALGLTVFEKFDYEHEAKSRMSELEGASGEKCELMVAEEELEIDSGDKPVTDEIPF
jgi:hypothetical protein